MQLILFGGAELEKNGANKLKILIKSELLKINPKHTLHIPFARPRPHEKDWEEGWLKELLQDTLIDILDARVPDDVEKFDGQVVFINGGHNKLNLIDTLNANPNIKKLILNAKYVIAESSGAASLGKFIRVDHDGNTHLKALNILPNCIIEGHFTARNRKPVLKNEFEKLEVKYGLGIDSHTGIILDPIQFPTKYDIIGEGKIYLFKK